MRLIRKRTLVVLALTGALVLSLGAVAWSADIFESEGQQFHFVGEASDATDPDNPGDNDVARFDTTSGEPVAMRRKVGEQVRELDNQLEFKYFMQDRNCGAGSPRIDLGVDTDGDGRADGFLEGHVQPDFACPNQNKWVYQDLTDDLPRWGSRGISGGPGNTYAPWSAVEALLGEAEVVDGQLIEDSQAFKPDNRGIAYYDLVTIGNQTYTDHSDSAGR